MKLHSIQFNKSISLAIVLALLTFTIAYAASGDLDATLSGDGKVVQYFGMKGQRGQDLALQSDGKIVVVGYTRDGKGWRDIVAARYSIDGKLDTTFGGKGYVIISITGKSSIATTVAIQTDGKIVLGGSTGYYDTDLVLVRLNTDGSLDTSFNRDGIVTADFNSDYNDCMDLVIQGTKIYVIGNAVDVDKDLHDGVIYRFNKNGYLDSTFSGDGILPVNFSRGEEFYAIKVVSGKIYITGTTTNTPGSNYDVVVARFTDTGFPDGSFGTSGYTTINLGANDSGNDIALYNDKVVVVGGSTSGFNGEAFILQFTNDGKLDVTFSGDGKVKTSLGYQNPSFDGVVIRNGKIIVVGQTNALSFNVTSLSEGLVARFDVSGNLDTSFNIDGIVSTVWPQPAIYTSVVIKGARIYTLGYYFHGAGADRLILAAYKP